MGSHGQFMRRVRRTTIGLLAGVLVATTPVMAQAAEASDPEPVLGGQLYSTGAAVTVEVLPASAGLTSTLFLLDPEEVQIATNRDVGHDEDRRAVRRGHRARLRHPGRRPGVPPRPGWTQPRRPPARRGRLRGRRLCRGGLRGPLRRRRPRLRRQQVQVLRRHRARGPRGPRGAADARPDRSAGGDAGPDQAVDEGSTVTLDGSGSRASTKPALQASEQQGTLPGGTSLGAALDGLDADAPGHPGRGLRRHRPGPGGAEHLHRVRHRRLRQRRWRGGPCGDVNGDRRSNTILDCELAAALKLQEEVEAAGTVDKVAVITFSSGASAIDLDPTSATATLVSPTADKDGNGVTDVVQAIKRVGGSGGTNFVPPVRTSCQLLATTGLAQPGHALSCPTARARGSLKHRPALQPAGHLPRLRGRQRQPLRQRTPRSAAGSSTWPPSAAARAPTCPTVSELPDILPQVVGSKITEVTYTVDGGAPVDLSSQLELPEGRPRRPRRRLRPAGRPRRGQPPDLPHRHRRGLRRHLVARPPAPTSSPSPARSPTPGASTSPAGPAGLPVLAHHGAARRSSRPTTARYVFELTVTDGTGGTATDRGRRRGQQRRPDARADPRRLLRRRRHPGQRDPHRRGLARHPHRHRRLGRRHHRRPVDVTTAGARVGHVLRLPRLPHGRQLRRRGHPHRRRRRHRRPHASTTSRSRAPAAVWANSHRRAAPSTGPAGPARSRAACTPTASSASSAPPRRSRAPRRTPGRSRPTRPRTASSRCR